MPCDLFFVSDKILPIDMLYFKSVSMLMHDVYRGYYTAAQRYEVHLRVVKTIFYE